MKNTRGAGRKSIVKLEDIDNIVKRISDGESVASIACEYGVSRQALYKRIKEAKNQYAVMEYCVDGDIATRIELDCKNEKLKIINLASRISKYAFGINQNPGWDDLSLFLEKQLFLKDESNNIERILIQELVDDDFGIDEVLALPGARVKVDAGDIDRIPRFTFSKKDILYSRTDTDGYQLKALSRDRSFFVKSQAIISGVLMEDWAVEIIASDLCKQLKIPCVEQKECEFVYGSRIYKGVYSENFELDGYTFVSFERLLERMGTSSKEDEFIRLDAISKLEWCAKKLSEAGEIAYEKTFKYMLDMAVIDCLVGNIDRHTRNFGLFYNALTGKYEIPLIFDNGMGLFENDGYRDKYDSFDAAMMHVYVSPYGEDPFDMMKMLKERYDLKMIYPEMKSVKYSNTLNTPYAVEYMRRMVTLWQK